MADLNGHDALGLHAAPADRLLPALVAAMSFLAALAIAGAVAAALLAARWQGDTASVLTVQVPSPDAAAAPGGPDRLAAVLAALRATQGVRDAHLLSAAELDRLLTPWLGADPAGFGLPLPAVIAAGWQGGDDAGLAAGLDRLAPGTLTARGAAWAGRVAALTHSLQACAAAVLCLVAAVAAAIVALTTRAGLAQRRETIEIVHGLGALDSDVARRFAARVTLLAAAGASAGVLLALPVLFWLAALAAPFAGLRGDRGLPGGLWLDLPALPLCAAAIGWLTAQLTVRGWLRRRV